MELTDDEKADAMIEAFAPFARMELLFRARCRAMAAEARLEKLRKDIEQLNKGKI